MASIHDDLLREMGRGHIDGEACTTICPECGKYGFSARRTEGKLLYHCFKAGCGFSGMVLLRGYAPQDHTPSPAQQEERLTPYKWLAYMLYTPEQEALVDKFGITLSSVNKYVRQNGSHYLLPILGPSGAGRGLVKRAPWSGTELGIPLKDYGPKSQIFKEKHEPMISWYFPTGNSVHTYTVAPTILVEDQMSAIKLADCGYLACALLGTNLSSEKVAEIQSVSKYIVIALDSDATATAFKLARKWQHGFSSCRVVILEKDVKDSSKEEIHAKFN